MLGSGPATGHSTAPAYVGDGRIEPSRMTGPDLQPNLVANAADTLLTSSKTIRTKGEAVHTAWAGLGASYQEAPEREQLLAVMDPVKTDTDDFGGRLGRVSSAISNFADTMAPLVAKLNAIYEEACAFRQTIDGGVQLSATDPQNPEYKAVMQSSAGAIPDFSHVKATTVSWKEHGPSVDTNTRLLGEYADQYAKLQNAEADCANAITKEVENSCVAKVTKVEAWQLRQPDVKLPWGERVEQKRDCQEGVVYGLGQSGVHLYQGVVSLVAGYNPQKDVYGDWASTGQAWLGLGTLVTGVTKIGDPIAWASRLIPDDAPAALVGMRDQNIAAQEAVANAAKGIVVADRWKDHPAEAFGETLGNVGTFFIPGADVASALKTGSLGARVASIGGHAADFLVPAGSLLLKGGADLALRAGEGVKIAGESIRLGSSALRGSLTDALRNVGDRMPRVEVSWEPASVTPGGVVVPGHLSITHMEAAPSGGSADSSGSTGSGASGAGSSASHGDASAAGHAPAQTHSSVDNAPPRFGERVPGYGAHDAAAGSHESTPAQDAGSAHDAAPAHHAGGHEPISSEASSHDAFGPGNGNDVPGDETTSGLHPSDDQIAWSKDGDSLTRTAKAEVDHYLAVSHDVEPRISASLGRVVHSTPGADFAGFADRLKTDESMYRKVATQLEMNAGATTHEVLSGVKDSVRYTVMSDVGTYSSTVARVHAQLITDGFKPFEPASNTWGSDGYRGINSSWIDPSTGRVFEVQFHTPQSFEAKTVTHDLYEKLRLFSTPPDVKVQLAEEQSTIFKSVPVPPEALNLGWKP